MTDEKKLNRILGEELLTTKQACDAFPISTHYSTVRRWMFDGVEIDGTTIKLESCRIGKRVVTSREACQRFFHATASATMEG